MIFIPRKLVPYFIAFLGIVCVVVGAMTNTSEKVSIIIVGVLAAIGGAVWAYIDIKRRRR